LPDAAAAPSHPLLLGLLWTIRPRNSLVILAVIAIFVVVLRADIPVLDRVEVIPKEAGLRLDIPPPTEDKRILVLFLHGWNGDAKETWQQFPDLVKSDPDLQHVAVATVPYPTLMVRRGLRAAELAAWLAEKLDQSEAVNYAKVVFIAHSMGGVIARKTILQQRLRDSPISYPLLAEIATPHQGAKTVARLGAELGLSERFLRDLIPESDFLTALANDWNDLKRRPLTMCFTSPEDRVVSEASATYQCERFKKYSYGGHTDMAKPRTRNDDWYVFPMSEVKLHSVRQTPTS
jgi:triacylglycerol esterase/lipase EstA (alpha/beta hydrolase family)